MAEFKAITTQEEFDIAIKDRLKRQEDSIKSQYADYGSLKDTIAKLQNEAQAWTGKEKELKDKADSLEKEKKDVQDKLDAADKKVKDLETDALKTKVAIEKGLPLELRSRLAGQTEDEIKADAEALAGIIGQEQRRGLPGFSPDDGGTGGNNNDAAFLGMLKEMKE